MTATVDIFKLKYDDIKKIFNNKTLVDLKHIGCNNNIRGYSVACKDKLLHLIFEQYDIHRCILLKNFMKDKLLDICRINKLITDDCKGLSKDMFIHILISAVYIKNKIIKHHVILEPDLTENSRESIKKQIEKAIKEREPDEQKLDELLEEKNKLVELIAEKKRMAAVAEAEKKRLAQKAKWKRIVAEKKRLAEEAAKLKEDNLPPPQYEESTNSVKRRTPLPACVRDSVWNHYIGEDINKHRCLCCKQVKINNREFQVGHVISVKDGGTDEINNLRPICAPCNHSMGSKNMVEFVKTYGYYIG